MRRSNYRHNEHYGSTDILHEYADAVLDHVWAGLIVRAKSGSALGYTHNRNYVHSEIRHAIALADAIVGTIDTTNNVCLRFTLECPEKPGGVTFWVPWDQIRGDLRIAGHQIDI